MRTQVRRYARPVVPTLTSSCPDTAATDVPPPLRVMIAYDDHVAYRRALRLLANTLAEDSDGAALQPSVWRFDELALGPFGTRARRDASEAEIFVISTSNEDELPAETDAWLDECFALRRNRATAVVALPSPAAGSRQTAGAFRARVFGAAKRAGLDFILADPADLAQSA